TKSAEWTIPGKFLYYATAMPRRTGAIPLIATTVDGRPIKLEGNPLHPASAGATDTFAQASVLDLYDPARSRRFVNRGKDSNRGEFDAYIDKLRGQLGSNGGAGLAFLVEELSSPTRERLRTELEKAFPKRMWCDHHRRNGRSSPALSCQPDSSPHPSARQQNRRCNQRRRTIVASLHTGRAREYG